MGINFSIQRSLQGMFEEVSLIMFSFLVLSRKMYMADFPTMLKD